MRPSEHLISCAQDDWAAVVDHPFCDALAAGTLPSERMARYLVQDYKFVESFARLLAAVVAGAPTMADMVPGARFLGVICGPENTYFLRAFEALGVGEAERSAPAEPVTAAFIALMDEARRSGRFGRMLAVLCVAEGSYLGWASRRAPPGVGLPFWFAEWITLHSGPDFEAVVAYLRGLIDDEWERIDEAERDAVRETSTRAVALERAFFDMAMA